jgi:hypothetical protein
MIKNAMRFLQKARETGGKKMQQGQQQMMSGGGPSFGGVNMNGIPNPTAGNVSGQMSPSGPAAEARREARRNR